MKFLLPMIIISLFKSIYNKLVSFKFKSEIPIYSYESELFQKLYHNNIYINLFIGNPEQAIPLIIKMSSYPFSVIDINEKQINDTIKFDKELSNTNLYFVNQPLKRFTNPDFYDAIKLSDYFYYKNKKGEKKNLGRLLFYSMTHVTESFKKNPQSGVIGLKLRDYDMNIKKGETGPHMDMDSNLVVQLKKNKIINNYAFTINYTSFNEGELIIGEYPHVYDSQNYDYSDFHMIKCAPNRNYNFDFYLDLIEYGNVKLINQDNYYILASLKIENSLIKPSYIFINEIERTFFEGYVDNDICQKICIYKNQEKCSSYSYVCNAKVNFYFFNNISFSFKEYNCQLNLTYKDLFYFNINDQKYYLLMEFEENSTNENWVLGAPFFRKHLLVFDQEKKIIGFYSNLNKKIEKKVIEMKTSLNLTIICFAIISFILFMVSLVFLVHLIHIFKKKKIIKRKQKMNEMVDLSEEIL